MTSDLLVHCLLDLRFSTQLTRPLRYPFGMQQRKISLAAPSLATRKERTGLS